MPRCCGCQGGAVYEPQEQEVNILDVTLLEASERSLKFGFRAPRASTKIPSSSRNVVRVGRGPLDFTVSVLGGPYNDVLGKREERLSNIACGARVEHEVSNLQPATEYTIHVGFTLPGGHALEENVEARTADATTALFAEEDWGRGNMKNSKDCKESGDEKGTAGKEGRETGGASSSSMSSPGASSSAARVVPPARTDTQDDVSTIAPSEAGEDTTRRFDDHASDSGSEEGDRREEPVSVEAVVVDEGGGLDPVTAIEIDGPPKRSIECKLFDCFKLGRGGKKPETSAEEIVVDTRQAAPKPAPKRRGFRPYRPPFPGTPVDPASVGLLPRHDVETA